MKAEKAIMKMRCAIQALQQAHEFSQAALEGTDVGDEYAEEINILIESMKLDLDAIMSGEVYGFD